MLTLHFTDVDYPNFFLAIRQGATFQPVALRFTNFELGDLALRGQLRDNYLSAGGKLLAEFSFPGTSLDYVPVSEGSAMQLPVTTIFPELSAQQTEALNPSQLIARDDASIPFQPGVNCWVWDLEAFEADVNPLTQKVYRLARGFAQISLEATR
jgi:hypothetical protein